MAGSMSVKAMKRGKVVPMSLYWNSVRMYGAEAVQKESALPGNFATCKALVSQE